MKDLKPEDYKRALLYRYLNTEEEAYVIIPEEVDDLHCDQRDNGAWITVSLFVRDSEARDARHRWAQDLVDERRAERG